MDLLGFPDLNRTAHRLRGVARDLLALTR